MSEIKEECSTCRYWERASADEGHGDCHGAAPAPIVVIDYRDEENSVVWPVTLDDDIACPVWRPRRN